MNATEDGDEPMGEAPVIEVSWPVLIPDATAMVVAKPGGLTSIPVLGENERQAIAEIRQLHRPCTCGNTLNPDACDLCDGCEREYPCETIRLLDARGL